MREMSNDVLCKFYVSVINFTFNSTDGRRHFVTFTVTAQKHTCVREGVDLFMLYFATWSWLQY